MHMSCRLKAPAIWACLFMIALLPAGLGHKVSAQPAAIKVVQNDRGGLIGARAMEIADLNAKRTRIELRGRFCYSSCTMYLGAENLCVSGYTIFGFHGPSRNGRARRARQFEHWTAVMAQHYNPPLRQWFMRDARHRIAGYYRITGEQLIQMGYPAC
ncbi:hypothetical protein [Yoonia sediminilitoris]|uniref:Uncharacterized protein n=1 Tax=Yoonia sediminilitoris TaxID=1286148 RepID=A0A2T6KB88_9RHOB|nr:hypothetical protein [Yoonia sediminilitoris]PUB12118.1 hypothetical protein C8N45_11195 [Yoonia sediminilitoris]RCW92945.1 hypothetical protein DFP92_11194 [Yoonia sediminilitoris]